MDSSSRSEQAWARFYARLLKKQAAKARHGNSTTTSTERVFVKEEPQESKLRSLLYPDLPNSPPLDPAPVEMGEYVLEEGRESPVAMEELSQHTFHDAGSPISVRTLSETVDSTSPSINNQQDIEDYNNLYCRACKRNFNRKDTYRQHLQKIHKKILNSSTTIKHPIILIPDKDDPHFNCSACKKNFNHKRSYRYHLEIVHGIACTPPTVKYKHYYLPGRPAHNRDTFCSKCQKGFDTRQGYFSHMKRTHQLIPILTSENTPDEDDPNFYCNACEKNFNSKHSFRWHLKNFHEMKLKNSRTVIKHPEALPDANDPNLYCAACERVYSTKDSFNNHMRRIHKLEREHQSRRKRQPPLYLLSTILLESTGLKISN